jgi:hypothetical protein
MDGAHGKLFVVVYVDDMMLFAEEKTDLIQLKESIKRELEITEIDEIKCFLNIGIDNGDMGSRCLQQRSYADKLLKRFDMELCKGVSTPMTTGCKLRATGEDEDETDAPYRQAVGMVQYLANCTRPDLSFTGSYLGQFASKPNKQHWAVLKRTLRYISGTKDLAIRVNSNNEELRAYSDADWAGSCADRGSYSGYIVFMGETPILWKARKQTCISLSTQEAEYIAMSECAKEIIWLGNFLEEMGLKEPEKIWPLKLWCDNTSAIRLAKNYMTNGRSKHIEIRYHHIKDLIVKGRIDVEYVAGEDNVADVFTKPLGVSRYCYLKSLLNLC